MKAVFLAALLSVLTTQAQAETYNTKAILGTFFEGQVLFLDEQEGWNQPPSCICPTAVNWNWHFFGYGDGETCETTENAFLTLRACVAPPATETYWRVVSVGDCVVIEPCVGE